MHPPSHSHSSNCTPALYHDKHILFIFVHRAHTFVGNTNGSNNESNDESNDDDDETTTANGNDGCQNYSMSAKKIAH